MGDRTVVLGKDVIIDISAFYGFKVERSQYGEVRRVYGLDAGRWVPLFHYEDDEETENALRKVCERINIPYKVVR